MKAAFSAASFLGVYFEKLPWRGTILSVKGFPSIFEERICILDKQRIKILFVIPFFIFTEFSAAAQGSSEQDMHGGTQMKLFSPAFDEGEAIPKKHSCDGEDISPQIAWSGAPEGTKTFSLIVDDPDAPGGTWVHWVIYNIPSETLSFGESVPANEKLNDGTLQGINDFKKIGYGGPCPPGGTHRYFFKLYALKDTLDLNPGATKKELLKAMDGKILAEAQLMGTYGR